MNRLPIPDPLIDAIIEHLKFNRDSAAPTSRQITNYFWENYNYPGSKTWNQLYAEVNAQIAIHKNKNNRHKQIRPLQIMEYQTVPYTYGYMDVLENTVLGRVNEEPEKTVTKKSTKKDSQLSFEHLLESVNKVMTTDHYIASLNETSNESVDISVDVPSPESIKLPAEVEESVLVEESIPVEESVLVEDIKACDKVTNMRSFKLSLIHWIITSDNKEETLAEIRKIMEEYA